MAEGGYEEIMLEEDEIDEVVIHKNRLDLFMNLLFSLIDDFEDSFNHTIFVSVLTLVDFIMDWLEIEKDRINSLDDDDQRKILMKRVIERKRPGLRVCGCHVVNENG